LPAPMQYPPALARLLSEAGADLGDEVEVSAGDGRVWKGLVMEHHAFSAPDVLTLKLASGYNVGVSVAEGARVRLLRKLERKARVPVVPQAAEDKPLVSVLATGGTIASYVDYRTGAVTPITKPEELAAAVPELANVARLRTKIVFAMFSEDLQPEHWQKLAREIKAEFDAGARGVVVTHGTDTLQFTAAALAFFLSDLPGPVVVVGAQRSSDRPSSDAQMNLHCAVVTAATTDVGEVVVVMHGGMTDDDCLIHRGTRVRKMHTSRRDAFESINALPLGRVGGSPPVARLEQPYRKASRGPCRVDEAMNERVAMIQSYPGLWPDHIESVVLDGVVLVGTGLGHVANRTFPALEKLQREGKFVFMASQCLHGRVNMNIYSTGRDLQRLGVIPCEDMLPEVAYVKAMWVLARAKTREEVERLFLTPMAGEIDARTDVASADDA
ncbi:MAG TPA: Glu-tRNA(Gln) amidotransferase subunit GatD, partial [Candidatus Thermoplasmatota archaeon]|nr:Glu-tRNA(Gln) amidotransferase subunit GatD [Candidatus Thermoplasmatota archaeon]